MDRPLPAPPARLRPARRGPAAANAATPPTVSSVAPLKLKIGERLTILGKGFLAGKNRDTVVFKRDHRAGGVRPGRVGHDD